MDFFQMMFNEHNISGNYCCVKTMIGTTSEMAYFTSNEYILLVFNLITLMVQIGSYKLFAAFVDSKPEGRKTILGVLYLNMYKKTPGGTC